MAKIEMGCCEAKQAMQCASECKGRVAELEERIQVMTFAAICFLIAVVVLSFLFAVGYYGLLIHGHNERLELINRIQEVGRG